MREREPAVEFVLFDLGGVLIKPGGVDQLRALSGMGSDEELWARWLGCRWVRTLERGDCSADEFAAGVVQDWGLTLSPEAFLAEFGRWPEGPYPGAEALVAEVRRVVPVGCLSNTNAFQWEAHYEDHPICDAFDLRFLSYRLGMVKPDREIFEAVAGQLPAPAGRVLFLDDNAPNVEAAAEAGYVARHVRGLDEARRTLAAAGVLFG